MGEKVSVEYTNSPVNFEKSRSGVPHPAAIRVDMMRTIIAPEWCIVRSYRSCGGGRRAGSTHFGVPPAGGRGRGGGGGRARGRCGRLAPGLEPQVAHGAHNWRGAGGGVPEDDALADEAGPKESHQDRDGR